MTLPVISRYLHLLSGTGAQEDVEEVEEEELEEEDEKQKEELKKEEDSSSGGDLEEEEREEGEEMVEVETKMSVLHEEDEDLKEE